MESIYRKAMLLALMTATPAATASELLCGSPQPYQYHTLAVDSEMIGATAHMSVTRPISGKPIVGPKPTVVQPSGFVAFSVESNDGLRTEVHYGNKPVAILRGIKAGADIKSGKQPLLLLLTYIPEDVRNHRVLAEQAVIDPRGAVIAARQIDLVVGEDRPVFKFTADGSGIYQVAAEMHKLDRIEVLDSQSFRTLSSFEFDNYGFIGVFMQSPKSGFAIGEDGQLFHLGSGKISPMESGGVGFVAHDIEADARSRRVLVRGNGGYRVYDWNGRLLFAQDGFTTGGMAYVPEVRLAIEGSIGVRNPAGKYVVRINRGGNYSKTTPLPLSLAEWRRVSCFTPHSAAWIDANGQPRRVSFSRRR